MTVLRVTARSLVFGAFVTLPAIATAQLATALPALRSDSIVALAVNPAAFAGLPFVTLLDEMTVRLEPDGRGTRKRRVVVQLLNDAAARAKAEQSFGYSPGHQTFVLNWVRVLKPSGAVVSDRAAQEQDADVPVAMQNPVYQDQKIRRLSLAGVTTGTILDMAWTVEEKSPYRAGDFYDHWFVNSISDVLRSRLVYDIPETFQPRIVEKNLNFRRAETTAGGRRIMTWAAGPLERVRAEPFAADSNDVIMAVTVAAPGTWNDLALWYHGLSKDRYALTPDVAKSIDSLVAASNARTRADTIKAVHRWVAQDVRYVSVSLGIGGYQPRLPAVVLSTGFGDCKDKATLFVAALRKYKFDASPVLLSTAGAPDRNLPSIFQFNHAIAAVRNGTGWTFTDLTAESVPYGMLPPSYQGHFGIVVLPDGKAQEVRFPEAPVDSNSSTVRMIGELKSNGSIVARVEDRSAGTMSLQNRQSFYAPMDSARRAGALRAVGASYFKDGMADSLVTFNGKDLSADVRIAFNVSAQDALKSVGTTKLFTVPPAYRGPAQNFANLARNLAANPSRKFALDVAQVVGPIVTTTVIELTLPVGWTAELPKNITATSVAGRYEATYVQEGRVLRMTRRITGARGVYAPQRIAEVIEWLKAAAVDDPEFIQLKPGP